MASFSNGFLYSIVYSRILTILTVTWRTARQEFCQEFDIRALWRSRNNYGTAWWCRGGSREDADQRQLLAERLGRIAFQQPIEFSRPPSQLRPRLNLTVVLERSLPRPQYLADRVPGYLQIPGNLPDRFAFDEMLAPNPADRLHCQHSPTARLESKRAAHQANL